MSKIITTESLTKLRGNFRKNISEILSHNEFDFSEVETESIQYPVINDISLENFYKQFKKEPDNEFELAKIIYESLPLNKIQASNNLYWIYLNLKYFFPYIKKRWVEKTSTDDDEKISNQFEKFFLALQPSQNNLIKSPIAGLWWSIHLTINKYDNMDDKYYYSRIFLSDRNLRDKNIGTYQFIRNKKTFFAVLEFYNENKDSEFDGKRIGSEAIAQQTSKLLNQIGGLTLLSFLSKEEIKKKLNLYKTTILERAYNVKKGKVISREKKQKENVQEKKQPINYDRYFCLNSESGSYKLTSQEEKDWDYCIGLDFDIENQFLIHFYQEGKIKKSKVNGSLSNKTVDRTTPYSNGKNKRLTLCDLKLINQPVLFGIAYKNRYGTFFKAMDEQDVHNFRIDNSALNQEGKKVLYIDEPHQTAFKILPYDIKEALGTLVQKSPNSGGAEISNNYYKDKWDALKAHWPELFDGSIEWN